ncbi:MAG: hypothetical protein HOQ01_08080 [Lysobacter sp.]|nr:hypothetical protein [Lysobacter sp.]
MNLTQSGTRLREKALSFDLRASCGLSAKDFTRLQKEIVTLRDTVIESAQESG